MEDIIHQPVREIPVLGQYDIVVCGAGMAGCGAAIAAARRGAKVLLVERLEMLGGLGAAGGVGNFCAAEGGLRGQGRVFDDIVSGLHGCGAMGEENGWPVRRNAQFQRENRTFDYRALPLVLQELVLAAGVDLLYATDVIGAELDGQRIGKVTIHNKSLTQRAAAEVFIDATGDGVLARHAGGRALPDDPQFPGVIKPSNMMSMRKTSQPVRTDDAEPVCTDGTVPNYSIWPDVEGHVALKMKLFHRDLDTSTGRGYSDAVIAMRNEAPRFAAHFRANHDSSWVYAGAAPMLGLRESCRIEGDYVLTVDDCRAGRRFDDAVAYGTFTVDANETSEILPPYQIPRKDSDPPIDIPESGVVPVDVWGKANGESVPGSGLSGPGQEGRWHGSSQFDSPHAHSQLTPMSHAGAGKGGTAKPLRRAAMTWAR